MQLGFFVCQGNNLENLEDEREVMVRQILNDVSAFDRKPRYIFFVCWIQSLCMAISDETEAAMIAIYEAMILENKATIASSFQTS